MAKLPPYEVLVRWTVADTTKWLLENNLNEFRDPFRREGVDGSKLAKLNDSDIDKFNVNNTKKRIVLKDAVSNIDRSRVASLPAVQGMMSRLQTFGDQAPPRPPRVSKSSQGEVVPPATVTTFNYDDDEEPYDWGDDFSDEGSSDEQDYENEEKWKEVNNNTEHDSDEDSDENYIEPMSPNPKTLETSSSIIAKLQRELTRRHTFNHQGSQHQESNGHSDAEDSDQDQDYVEPLPDVPPARPPRVTPAVPPIPAAPAPKKRDPPPPQVPRTRVPPRPKVPAPEPEPEEEAVYEEPDNEEVKKEEERARKKSRERQLPPLPKEDKNPPSPVRQPPRPTGRKGGNQRLPSPPPEDDELYEPMDQGTTSKPNHVPEPAVALPPAHVSQAQRNSLPLPSIPGPKNKAKQLKVTARPPPPSLQDELEHYDWYHKNISRPDAESRLKTHNVDGMYVIRRSRRVETEQEYSLSIQKQGEVFHLPIRKRKSDDKFALGKKKENELVFDSLPSLVDYFREKLIKLNPRAQSSSGSTSLLTALPK